MLRFLNVLQVVLYVPLLALLGQGALAVLAGGRRHDNFFFKLLVTLSSPFTVVVRRLTPKALSAAQVAVITFFLLLVGSFVVFVERGYLLCEQAGYPDCR